MKIFQLLILSIFISFNAYADNNSTKCQNLYSEENYKAALPYCLKSTKGNEFRLGYIYSELRNCSESHKWFKKDNSKKSLVNMSIDLIYGNNVCKKNYKKAEQYLKSFNDRLDHCVKHEENKKTDFLGKCLKYEKNRLGDWLVNLYLAKLEMEKKNINIPNVNTFKLLIKSLASSDVSYIYETDWERNRIKEIDNLLNKYKKNITQNDINYMMEIFSYSESFPMVNDEIHKFIYQNDEIFISRNKNVYSLREFAEKNMLFLLQARMYDLGVGEIENKPKAYRFYLLEAKNGNAFAMKWKDNLKTQLTKKEIANATCIAKRVGYEEPNWFDRIMC